MLPEIKTFDYWNLNFKIETFNQIADEIAIDKESEEILCVVVNGSILILDYLDNRQEYLKGEVILLKKQRLYTIRSTSEDTVILLLSKNDE